MSTVALRTTASAAPCWRRKSELKNCDEGS